MPCMHLWEPFCLAILNDTPMCDSSGHELAVELPPLRIGFKFLISTMFFFFFYCVLLQLQPHPPIHPSSLTLPPVTLLNHIISLIYYLQAHKDNNSVTEHDLVGGAKKGCEHEGGLYCILF